MGQIKKKVDFLKKVVVVLFSLVFISSFAAGCGSSVASTNNGATVSTRVNELMQNTKGETATEEESMTASTEAVQEQTEATEKSVKVIAEPIQIIADTSESISDNQDIPPVIIEDIKASDIHLTLGSSKSDVISSLGEPYSTVPYGSTSFLYMYKPNAVVPRISGSADGSVKSTVVPYYFAGNPYIIMDGTENDEHIAGWNDTEGVLKISIGEKSSSPKPITLGSSIQEVVEAAGTPPFYAVNDSSIELRYDDHNYISTDLNGKVNGWSNYGICTTYIEIDPSAPPIKVGSTREEVGRAMGAPIVLRNDLWEYSEGRIVFDYKTGTVKDWIVYQPGLKVE